MNYYQHHIGDFIRDTARLSDSQCMAYLRMMWMYYEDEKPLTSNTKVLALKIGCPEDDIIILLESFFQRDGDVWRHARCDRELESYKRISDGGKLGASRRWSKGVNRGALPTISPPQCDPNTNHKPITNNQEPLINNTTTLVEQTRPNVNDQVNEVFEFWKLELNHSKASLDKTRHKAIKARLSEGYTPERIKQAIRGIKKSPHNMGQNDRNTVYDDIELICRSGKNVDRFADMEQVKNASTTITKPAYQTAPADINKTISPEQREANRLEAKKALERVLAISS